MLYTIVYLCWLGVALTILTHATHARTTQEPAPYDLVRHHAAISVSTVIHRTCDRYLEPDYRCGCLSWDLDERNRPEVAWLASRPLKPGSKVTREKKHRYEKACKEVERLNRLYAGKVQHFLLPVS